MRAGVLPVPHVAVLAQRGLARLGRYFVLIKSPQTGLLLVTAAAGYISGCCLNITAGSLAALLGSLFLSISGSTVLNMVYDRDIDARMARTSRRPLPAGEITSTEAWILGGILVAAGLAWSAWIDLRYAIVVLAGIFFDVVIYTMLLKRRTAYSILVGGLAGGMPALAGRVLATGQADLVGWLLMLGVLLWIPTHIMTFSIKHQVDYARAGVPTFPSLYGEAVTRRIIAGSTLLAAGTLIAGAWLIGLSNGLMATLFAAGLLLCAVVFIGLAYPGPRLTFALYKSASIYMLMVMGLLIAGGL
jgi:protoheme IX farnesyltransferase